MSNDITVDRFDRQRRIPGWDQEKIKNSIITIVGSNALARETAIPLAAMGVGTIVMIGNDYTKKNEMMLDLDLKPNNYRVSEWEKSFKEIFKETSIIPIRSNLETRMTMAELHGSNIIIDTTNSSRSKVHTAQFGKDENIPTLLISTMPGYFKFVPGMPGNDLEKHFPMHMFNGMPEDELMSIMAGGLVAEEAKKLIFNQTDIIAKEPIYYKLGNGDRTQFLKEGEFFKGHAPFTGKSALVIGNGALDMSGGGRVLAAQGYDLIYRIDMDTVEETNLNRQIGHYRSVGKPKVDSANEFYRKISKGKTIFDGHVGKFEGNLDYINANFHNMKFDVIFDWVDNLYTRALVSVYSINSKTPLITAATNYESGEWTLYAPGKTNCMDHFFNIHTLGAEEERIRRQSCTAAPNPSVITSNQISGSASALEAGTIFHPEIYGEPINHIMKYSSSRGKKLGVTEFTSVCDCHNKGVEQIVVEETPQVEN